MAAKKTKQEDIEPVKTETVKTDAPESDEVETDARIRWSWSIDLVKFKVLRGFKDAKTSTDYEKGDVIKLSIDRAAEINKESIDKYFEAFLENVRIGAFMDHPRYKTIEDFLKILQLQLMIKTMQNMKRNIQVSLDLSCLIQKIQKVADFINWDVKDLPDQLDSTIAMMASSTLGFFGLLDTDAEIEKANKQQVKQITEGDVSISFDSKKVGSDKLSDALGTNPITGNYKAQLLHYRRLRKWDT